MATDKAQEWRKKRLQALVDRFHGKAELGRALGYRDGAFVGQMLRGLRPITEKTVEAAEALQGCRGWFATAAPLVPDPPGELFAAELPEQYQRLLADLDDIPPARRSKLIDHIHQLAEEAREAAEHHLAKREKTAAARQSSVSRTTAAVSYEDRDARPLLPLATVDDPFSAEPEESEARLYRRIAKHPKAKSAEGKPRARTGNK